MLAYKSARGHGAFFSSILRFGTLLTMQLSASLFLLVLHNSVRGATVLAPAAKPTQFVTLDIVNAPTAPDGFTRSMSMFSVHSYVLKFDPVGVLANGT
jgi:hypothetical protein